MRLLIDLQGAQTASRYRGIGRQARELAACLIQAAGAHDVQILLNAGLTDGLDELCRDLSALLPTDRIRFFSPAGQVNEINSVNLWRMRVSELQREAFIADCRPDVVYVTSLFEGVVDNAVTSIGLMQAPHATAATLFDLIPLYDPAAYLGADFMRNFYYRRALSLKRADRLVAISESAKNEAVEMLQIPAERIDVALLAADPAFRRPDFSEDEKRSLRHRYGLPESFIFYVGAIEPRKNIPLIIEAFGKLSPSERKDTVLVFGGRLGEAERVHLQATAARCGVDVSKLLMPGFIAEEDLAPLYGLSSLFVFPSIQEGFGLPPLEAMACGAPVLVARNSSLPEVVGREDQLFDTFDAADLARKMARILSDTAYSDELRAWGVERAARFSWPETGRRTLDSLEQLHDEHRQSRRSQVSFRSRPLLAFVSPLPADRSGIATYGSELLRELSRYYEIECVIDKTAIADPWVIANFPLRDVAYFRSNADTYDSVIYQFGNSEYHAHMFDLLVEIPGVVILHDFFLSGVLDWLGNVDRRPKEHFLQNLYQSHGLPALVYAADHGRHVAAEHYPANHVVFANAHGVIVHSQWSIDQARRLYGEAVAARIVHIPQLRAVAGRHDRLAARERLGIPAGAFVVSTFGFVAETKFGDRLVEAWRLTRAARSGGSLFFVGDHPVGLWGEAFTALVETTTEHGSVEVTGFASEAAYEDHLAATDVAVQLRQQTRGETSRAVLDCMAAGVPVVVNAHGTFAELDAKTVFQLPETFTARQLADAIDLLFADPGRREALGAAARDEIVRNHHPARVGASVHEAIEHFTTQTSSSRQSVLVKAIANLYAPVAPGPGDLPQLAQTIAKMRGRVGLRRIYYDITLLAESDAHTGVERVVRSFLAELMRKAPEGYLLEPVRFQDGQLHFARAYVSRRFGIAADVLSDAPIDYDDGDIYIMLEWAAEILPRMTTYLQDFRRSGGKVVIGIHDLLPLMIPHRFPDFIAPIAERWFMAAVQVADQFICVSRCVADDVIRFGNSLASDRPTPIKVDHFHIGADIDASLPTKGMPLDAEPLLERIRAAPTFIVVGTLEPRKGHQQVLEAFKLLWSRGVDVNLVIVGRAGWSMDGVIKAIEASHERGKRLHWITGASDEYLDRLYGVATALIAASEGEGFGLPLIEGARRDIPLLVRDIPVFREVAGDHAYYFTGETGGALADAIVRWLDLHAAGETPVSSRIRVLRWAESVRQFEEAMFSDTSYGMIGE